jgi:Tfp pilus assembly PilM family ATPase
MRRASVVGVRRDEVQHWLAAAKLAGLSIEVVECWLCSLIRLHRFLRGGTPHPVVLCHIGRGHSLFAVVAGESVLAHRTVAWGTDLIEQRLKVNLELLTDEDHAAALVRDIGLGFGDPQAHDPPASTPTDPVDRTVYQLAAPLVDELIHNFHSLTGFVMAEIHRVQFEGLFLYGRAASVRGLAAYVQQRTGLATEVVGPASQPASTGPGENPTPAGWGPFDLAVGLGMRRVSWL